MGEGWGVLLKVCQVNSDVDMLKDCMRAEAVKVHRLIGHDYSSNSSSPYTR